MHFCYQYWNIGDVADWKSNGVLEYFRYMVILQNTSAIATFLISGIYEIIKQSIQKVVQRKKERVKFENERKEIKFINKLDKKYSTKQPMLYLQTV